MAALASFTHTGFHFGPNVNTAFMGTYLAALLAVMQQTCHEVLNELGVEDNPTLRMAQRLEKIALEDSYFVDKRLYPNVDFYSGIILKAIGIPVEMFTVIFATGRTPGWIAHWNEMIGGGYRLGRPRQLYQGHQQRDFVPLSQR